MERRQLYIFLSVLVFLAAVISIGSFSLTGFVLTGDAPAEPPATQASVDNLKSAVNQLQTEVNSIQTITEKNEQEISRLSGNVQGLTAQISQLQQDVESKVKTVSTGLAGLQGDVQSGFSNLEASSQQRRVFLVIIAIIAAALIGIIYFYFHQKKSAASSLKPQLGTENKIMDYITQHIKQGRKYHHIKQNLQNAGWPEEEIRKAYQDTLKRNYHLYKKKKNLGDSGRPDKIKIIGLVGAAVIFTSIIVFFAFGTSTGQAYQKYGGVEDYEEGTGLNRVLSERQCFPPRIMINGLCCDDRNQNNVCDGQEGYTETAISALTGTIVVRAATPQDSVQNRLINITANGFEPSQLEAVQGDVIQFTNSRNGRARVIPDQQCPPMNSSLIATGETFTWTPVNPGNCGISIGIGNSDESCADNNQCAGLRACVDNHCKFIADIYSTTACSEYCTIIRVKVTTFNEDPPGNVVKQNYTLRMGLGSYTAGGALDWIIKPIPDFCKPSSSARIHQESNTWRATIPIPFEIREFSNGNLLGTRVETINTGQEKVITHSQLSLDQFTLKIEDVHLTCGGQTVFG